MLYLVRTWVGERPLPGLDVRTDSAKVAAQEAVVVVKEHGSWDDVSVRQEGARPLRGEELRQWAEKVLG